MHGGWVGWLDVGRLPVVACGIKLAQFAPGTCLQFTGHVWDQEHMRPLAFGGGGLRTGPSPVGELTPMCPVLAGVLLLRRLYKHALLLPLEAPSLPGCMPSG